jgi:hypothetical protein
MRLVTVAVFLLISVFSAIAQTDRGTITGAVSDPAGAVVAGAAVEAKSVDSGTTYEAGTSTTGNYTLAQMPAGTYELSIILACLALRNRFGPELSLTLRLRSVWILLLKSGLPPNR